MSTDVRAHVIISGKVQGVFFRAETRRTAVQLGLHGWVRNTADGNVEAVFEGAQRAVDRAVEWCRRGTAASNVTDVQVTYEDFIGGMEGFDIRR